MVLGLASVMAISTIHIMGIRLGIHMDILFLWDGNPSSVYPSMLHFDVVITL